MAAVDGDPTRPASASRPGAGDAAPFAAVAATDRYVLLDRLGEGGMGVVWAAYDRSLDRKVAVKVLHDRFLGADHQARLAEEARTMARLSHPNVVAVYDVGERAGRTYLAMELVTGRHLGAWLGEPRGWREVVEVFRGAGLGLTAAHAAGVIHRDVKPSNLLVGDDGRVRVTDFGVAGPSLDDDAAPDPAAAAPVTLTAAAGGTPAYMAPERLRGAPADERSDQFAFAVTLYQALHGRRPFAGDSVDELAEAMTRPAPAARDVPRWLAAVVARGLALDPAARFPSMRDLVRALDRRPRRRWLVAAGAVVAVVAGGGVAVAAMRGSASHQPSCDAMNRVLDGVWDHPNREVIRRQFASIGQPGALEQWAEAEEVVDRWTRRWSEARAEACRATYVAGGESEEVLARRYACLDAQLDDLRALTRAARGAGVNFAGKVVVLAGRLPSPVDCLRGDPTTWVDDGPAVEHLSEARGHLSRGLAREARAAAERALAAAGGDRDLRLRALLVRGEAEQAAGDAAAAAASYRAALVLTGRSDGSRVDALLGAGRALLDAGHPDQAEVELAAADELIAHLDDPIRELRLWRTRTALFRARGQDDRALDQAIRAVKVSSVELGVESEGTAEAVEEVVTLYLRLGHREHAVRDAEARLAQVAPLGDEHYLVARARRSRAEALAAAGRTDEARADLERALPVLMLQRGPTAPVVVAARRQLAALPPPPAAPEPCR